MKQKKILSIGIIVLLLVVLLGPITPTKREGEFSLEDGSFNIFKEKVFFNRHVVEYKIVITTYDFLHPVYLTWFDGDLRNLLKIENEGTYEGRVDINSDFTFATSAFSSDNPSAAVSGTYEVTIRHFPFGGQRIL